MTSSLLGTSSTKAASRHLGRQAGKVGMQPQWQVAVLIGSDYYRT
jgi:hypothetical protein